MDTVMVETLDQVRPFEEYEMWGENAGPNKVFDAAAKMFIPRDCYRNFVSHLQEFRCQICTGRGPSENNPSVMFGSLRKLEDHYRDAHQRLLCHTCLAHKKVFLAEQSLYTKNSLTTHLGKGEPSQGFFGHPRCEFCRCRFYDKQHLFEHLTRDHYSCHLCERAGIQHKYYKNYVDVEDHFRADHFLCDHPRCLEKKFVVFDNDIDLTAHQAKEHPELGAKRTIKLNFKVKRAGHDGSGFDSLDGGISGRRLMGQDGDVHEWQIDGITTNAEDQQLEATLRASIANGMHTQSHGFRQAEEARLSEQDFPDLSGRVAVPGEATWAGLGAAGKGPKVEDFPALPPSSKPVRQFQPKQAAFRNAVQNYPTKALELYQQQDDGWEYPGGGNGEDFVASLPKARIKKKKGGGKASEGVDLSRLKPASAPTPSPNNQPSKLVIPPKKDQTQQTNSNFTPPPPPPLTAPDSPGPATKMQSLSIDNSQTQILLQIKDAIGDADFQMFKFLSQSYRAGTSSAEEYYHASMAIIPSELRPRFTDLVSQIPDDVQRTSLLKVALEASKPPVDASKTPVKSGPEPDLIRSEVSRVPPASKKKKDDVEEREPCLSSSPSASPVISTRKGKTGLCVVKPASSTGMITHASGSAQLPGGISLHTDFSCLGAANSVKKQPKGWQQLRLQVLLLCRKKLIPAI